jgi:hypothetical protein
MNLKQSFLIILPFTIVVIAVYSCADLGSGPSSMTALSASEINVSVSKGTSTQVTLSGGTQPYNIKKQANSAIASVSLNSSTLTIAGVDTGSTSIVIADSKTPVADSLIIQISTVGAISAVSFSGQIQPIFNSQCTGCHGGSGGLTLNNGISYSNLVNVGAQSSCTSLKRVLPNDANNSVLYKKVSGTTCGSRMPQGASLNANEIALIKDWIDQGAGNN